MYISFALGLIANIKQRKGPVEYRLHRVVSLSIYLLSVLLGVLDYAIPFHKYTSRGELSQMYSPQGISITAPRG